METTRRRAAKRRASQHPPQRLVMDANIFIAAFLRDSTVRKIIILSGIHLFVPEHLLSEVKAHLVELRRRAGLQEHETSEVIDRLTQYLIVVPHDIVAPHLAEAIDIMQAIDPKDAPYLACAVAINCEGIWSDDPHLKAQKRVKCWTTKELVDSLRRSGFRL